MPNNWISGEEKLNEARSEQESALVSEAGWEKSQNCHSQTGPLLLAAGEQGFNHRVQ